MNCKEFHIEVEAGLKDTRLSASAREHAAACPPCHEFNQKHIEFREWLTVCQKVTAPKDFGFGVQRKIANAGSTHSHDWLWRGLRYIAPAAALATVLILGISYMNNYRNAPNEKGSAALTDSQAQAPAPSVADNAQPANSTTAQSDNSQKPENEKLASGTNTNKQDDNSRIAVPKDDNSGGGSLDTHRDFGVKPVAEPKTPAGISSQTNKSNIQISLQNLGVITGTENGATKVTYVKLAAARAGIKVGDLIQSVSGNTVTVNRNGLTVQITLKK
jgi:hypothetical protein